MNVRDNEDPAYHNRQMLLRSLEELSARYRGTKNCFALLLLNLGGFREASIAHGYLAWHQTICGLMKKIQSSLKEDDLLMNTGDDEIAIVLANIKVPQIAYLAADKVLNIINGYHETEGSAIGLYATCGCAIHPDHATEHSELLRAADYALHTAQKQGEAIVFYDKSFTTRRQRIITLQSDLRLAFDKEELRLFYQPQVDIRNGGLYGYESLMRWSHSKEGWITPGEFIPAAEQCDLIHSLTFWSFNVAFREYHRLSSATNNTRLSLNLSARLLDSHETPELIQRAMNIWAMKPENLTLEVTESAMMKDPRKALEILSTLDSMGIALSIDDFGTGYSSLSYLRRLPVKELKIDKSFVQRMATDLHNRQIVQSVIDLAHNLDMRVVAEGIEDRLTLDMLNEMGCDFGQGYYIARPMPLASTLAWANKTALRPPPTGEAAGIS